MAKISGIYVEIRGDATQLKKELASARQAVTQQAHGMSDALNNALSPQQLKNSINGLVKNLNQLSQASKVTGKDFAAIGADLGGLQRLTGLSAAEFGKLQSKMMQTQAAKAQEQAIRNIAKAAGLSADEVQRLGRQMGVSASGIAAVTGVTKEADKAMSGLSSVARTAAGVFAGLALAKITSELSGMVDGLKGAAMLSARYETLGVVMGVVGNNAGYTRAEMDALEAGLRKTGITAIESRNNLASMASANMDLSKASQLARMAQDAAVVGNINSSEAFKQMIYGIKSAQVEVLRTIGINVSFENSYKKVADQLGKNTTELTEQEKTQARLNAVLAQAPTIAGVYEESLTTVGKKLASTARYSEDARVKIGDVFQPALVLLVDTYTDALKGVNAQLENTEVIEKWARVIKSEVLDIMQIATSLNMVLAKAGQAATVVGMGVYGPGAALGIENSEKGFEYFAKQNLEYQKQFTDSEAYLNKLIGEQGRLVSTVREQTQTSLVEQARISAGNARRAEEAAAILAAGGGDSEKAAAKAERARKKALKDAMERNALEPYQVTQLEQMNKGDMFYGKADAEKRGLEMLKDMNRENLQLQTEFADKYKEVVLGETAFKLAQIDAQGDAYRKAGADEVAVAQWVEAEKLKVSREWSDGVQRGLADYADSATNAAQLAQDAITGGFKGMEDALVDFVKTGKLSFSELADSIISDMMRIMIQQSITGPLASAAGGLLSNLFSPSVASVGAPKVGYAKGGVPGAPSLSAYANSIVSSPTIFPFAKGVGLMGEAGPEAIMPLKRGPDGTLGVRGGGSNVVVNVIESPGNGGQRQERQEGGTTIIDIMVEQIEAKLASNTMRGQGPLYSANKQAFGLSRAPGEY